jgi:hypothetical protein
MKIVLLVGISFFAIGISSWAQQKALSKPSVAVLLARLEEIPEVRPEYVPGANSTDKRCIESAPIHRARAGALPQRASRYKPKTSAYNIWLLQQSTIGCG